MTVVRKTTTRGHAKAPVILSPQEVSDRTGLALQTLANWRSTGRGPSWRKLAGELNTAGGIVGYPEVDLERWLHAKGVTADQLRAALAQRRRRRSVVA